MISSQKRGPGWQLWRRPGSKPLDTPPELWSLALEVLRQAVEDLGAEEGELREAAWEWLFVPNEGFGFWAGLLGVEDDFLRDVARRMRDA